MKHLIFLAVLISSTQLYAQNFSNAQDPQFIMLSQRAKILGLTPPTLATTKPNPQTMSSPTPTNDDEDGFAPLSLQALDGELDAFLEQLNTLTKELSILSKQRNTL